MNQLPLQPAQVVDKQDAMQVIDLVLQGPGQQLLTLYFKELSLYVLRAHLHPGGPMYLLANFRQAQAAFLFELLALAIQISGLMSASLSSGLSLNSRR